MTPPVPQDLPELQLCDWRVRVGQDRLVPHILRAAAAPIHLPHFLCGAHCLRLPQPPLHDGSTVSDISEPLAAASTHPLSLFDIPGCLLLRVSPPSTGPGGLDSNLQVSKDEKTAGTLMAGVPGRRRRSLWGSLAQAPSIHGT